MLWIAVLGSLLFLSWRFPFCHVRVSAPFCASARLVVLKGFVAKKTKKTTKKQKSTPRRRNKQTKTKQTEKIIRDLPSSSLLFAMPRPLSHPGIGLHVNMEAGGHLDARPCRRVGPLLATRTRRPEQRPMVNIGCSHGSARCRESLKSRGAASTSCFRSRFHLVLPFQHYSTSSVLIILFLFFLCVCFFHFTLECFCPQKIYLFFFCATFHHCVQYRMCQWWQYVYQLNIWLLFKTTKSMRLNSMFYFSWRSCMPLFALKSSMVWKFSQPRS